MMDTIPTLRDADLLLKVQEAAPFLRDSIISNCLHEQQRRDKLAGLSSVKRRRAEIHHLINNEKAVDRQDLRHIHSVLAICSLPYTKQPLAVREWERKQGRMNLMVTAGKLLGKDGEWVEQPLPYGSRARLLLLHTCSEALRQNSATIELEDSLTGFIKAMGFSATGGKNGTLTSFKQQINALAACSMRIGVWNGEHAKTVNTQPFSSIDVWFPTAPDQRMLWPSTVTFSQDFYQTLTKHALPINMHAVRAFSSSPRKLDMIFWLGYRINSKDKAFSISWEALEEQWGAGYNRSANFRRDFAGEIAEIKEVFPKLPVKVTEVGITVSPGTSEVLAVPIKVRKS